jgi:hypothetical protein
MKTIQGTNKDDMMPQNMIHTGSLSIAAQH